MPKNVKCKNCLNLNRNHWCERVFDSPDEDMIRDCRHFCQKTNADRIRAMTDEELADFFFESPEIEFSVCEYCKNFGGHVSEFPCRTEHGCCDISDKNEAFKKWLQQPAKEDT